MSNRWLRFVIALLALAAAGAAGFKIFDQEQRFTTSAATHDAAVRAAETATITTADIKAALHAYVAAGQSQLFWTSRAQTLLDTLRDAVLELDGVASSMGVSASDALDLSDRLAASEQRARDYVTAGQPLLASDVIFTEARDLVDGVRTQIARARDAIAGHLGAEQAAIRREQATLALAAAGILALAVLILVPPGRSTEPDEADTEGSALPAPAGFAPGRPLGTSADKSAEASANAEAGSGREGGPGAPEALVAPAAPPAPGAPAAPPSPAAPAAPAAPALSATASLCSDLARVSDSSEISGLLQRACDVLDASGIILWMSSPDRGLLFPVASAGYDDRLISRIGPIAREESNLTAVAFREGESRTTAAGAASRAALAVPLIGPEGAVGVFSAELKGTDDLVPHQVDLAVIVAAQLSMIVGALTVEALAATAHQAQA